MSIVEYNQVQAPELLFSKNPNVLPSIVERRAERFHPRGSRSSITPGSTIEFEITHDQFLDLQSAGISLTLDLQGAVGAAISNICDVIDRIEVFYNDSIVDRIQDVAAWSNTYIAFSANADYANSEGSALLGLTNQFITTNPNNGDRQYIIPMALISPVFMMSNYLPLLSNKLRISILLQNNTKAVISKFTTSDTYVLNNVSLMMDTIIVTREYRDKIIQAMQTDNGFRIPFTSWTTGRMSVVGTGTSQQLQISNNHTNALSLHLLYHNETAKNAAASGNWVLWNQSFPLTNFSSLYVRSGSKIFTPPDRINGFAELYVSQEKCLTSFANLGSSGWVTYKQFSDGYTSNATLSSGTYGLCLLSVNLEKTLTSDYDTINSGLSSGDGATNMFDVEINTSSALVGSDSWLYAIVHKRTLIFANSGIDVEY